MNLYTGKGDKGTTTIFGCDQRISKSSAITEALGSLDEANSFLGLCKIQADINDLYLEDDSKVSQIIHSVQNDLFIIQAEVAGADKFISQERLSWLEKKIAIIEEDLPEIKTFFIAGGSELASSFDFARTLVRRAERRVVAVYEEKKQDITLETLAYINRLSSLLYVLVRFSNLKTETQEKTTQY